MARDRGPRVAVVEPWLDSPSHRHPSRQALDPSRELAARCQPRARQQHRVGHADRPLRGLKGGLQHVGVGQVAACGREWSLGSQGEAAALLGVENRAERARGVEIWEAQPVQRPVARHQGHRAPVANRCVVAKRDIAGVAHAASVLERPLPRCVVSSPHSRRRAAPPSVTGRGTAFRALGGTARSGS